MAKNKSLLYTATGDKGMTSLVGGIRISKASCRIDAYGTVDELNAHIGLLLSHVPGSDNVLSDRLLSIQSRLFEIGGALATETKSGELPAEGVDEKDVIELEEWIDDTDGRLPALRSFVLPGGCESSSRAHVARTVCRRAEREIVRLSEQSPVSGTIMRYINRLSDYLFALSRYLNIESGVAEIAWHKKS